MPSFVKLPDKLKMWKISSFVSSDNNCDVYKVGRKDEAGNAEALLRHISISGEEYNDDNIKFFDDEAAFLKTVAALGDFTVYADICAENNKKKETYDLFILTKELSTLSDVMKTRSFEEGEILDFGIEMCGILETLEKNNIFHGNLCPANIFTSDDGKYLIGGFSDFEGKIEDMSYIAPEVSKKDNADFTTDIYSLGLIMYAMSNNGSLPFETDGKSAGDACGERLSGKAVTAPKNGSEKLKSVIVIACQYDNANRWKNAGNIKNALSSIRDEQKGSDKSTAAAGAVIAPEATDFSGNVFEDFEYEDEDEFLPDEPPQQKEAVTAEASVQNEESTDDSNVGDNNGGYEIAEVTDAENEAEDDNAKAKYAPNLSVADGSDKGNTPDDAVANTDVFDEYAAGAARNSFKRTIDEKDYGDYFEDEPEKPAKAEPVSEGNASDNEKDTDDFDSFEDYGDANTNNHRKRNIAIVVICVLVMLAVLGAVAYFALNGFGFGDNKATTQDVTEAQTTVQATATTAEPTTVQPTTAAPKIKVTPVVGYGYSYGKSLLEDAGFKVEISEYRYSTEYEEGYIIEQTPDGEAEAKKGDTVQLVISSGLIVEATEEPEPETPQSSRQGGTDDSFIFADSSSSYLSNSQVQALSDSELQLAINEIYARNGRIFTDPSLNEYFNSKSWYEGKYTADEFNKNVTFNTYEQKNLQLMINERSAR